MRFLSDEHAAITAALADHGIDPAAVLFMKRRGWLHRIEGTFAFIRLPQEETHDPG